MVAGLQHQEQPPSRASLRSVARMITYYCAIGWGVRWAVAPVAYQVIILEPGIGQFREFEPRRVHTCINSLGIFLVDKLTCGKRESVS